MTLVRVVFCVALMMNSLVAYSSDENIKKKKLLKLAQYEEMSEITKRYKYLCLQEMDKISPIKLVKVNPEYFGGITPDSKYWSNVEDIYGDYVKSSCSYLDEKNVLNMFVSIYDEEMSDEALDGILEFYKSPAGTEYLKANSAGNARMQKYYAEAATPVYEKAMKKYTEEIGILIRNCCSDGRQ